MRAFKLKRSHDSWVMFLFQQFLWQFLLWFIDTFPKWCYFRNFLTILNLQKNISSSLLQYSERTIASAETNNTSKGRSDTQIFGAGKFKGVPSSGGLHAYFLKKGIEQKVNLMEQSQDSKRNFNWANLILIWWGKSGIVKFEFKTKYIHT